MASHGARATRWPADRAAPWRAGLQPLLDCAPPGHWGASCDTVWPLATFGRTFGRICTHLATHLAPPDVWRPAAGYKYALIIVCDLADVPSHWAPLAAGRFALAAPPTTTTARPLCGGHVCGYNFSARRLGRSPAAPLALISGRRLAGLTQPEPRARANKWARARASYRARDRVARGARRHCIQAAGSGCACARDCGPGAGARQQGRQGGGARAHLDWLVCM